MKRKQFIPFWIVLLIILPIVFYFFHATIPFHADSVDADGTHWGFLHWFYFFIVLGFWFAILINGVGVLQTKDRLEKFFFMPVTTGDESGEEVAVNDGGTQKFFRTLIAGSLAVIVLFFIGKVAWSSVLDAKQVYNNSKVYQNQYQQRTTERKGFYDKLWKTFLQKEKVTNLNKDVFIQVSKIIMENRQDGQQVTWKWVQENQNIPYQEFTKFYADLSGYIESQREEYYALEKQCQSIATANNMLLDTFPNNIYNRFLERPNIEFQYGFLSDSTDRVFASKKENVQ